MQTTAGYENRLPYTQLGNNIVITNSCHTFCHNPSLRAVCMALQ